MKIDGHRYLFFLFCKYLWELAYLSCRCWGNELSKLTRMGLIAPLWLVFLMECKKLFLPLIKLSTLLILQSVSRQTTTIDQPDRSIRNGHFRATKLLVIWDLIQLKMLWYLICFFNGLEIFFLISNISNCKFIYDKHLDYQTLQHPQIRL